MRTVNSLQFAPHTNISASQQCCGKCISSKLRHSGGHSYHSVAWTITFGVVSLIAGFALHPVAGNFVQIQLSLNRSCEDWALLLVKLHDIHLPEGVMCKATYRRVSSLTPLELEIDPANHDRLVTLGSLKKKTAYSVQMTCGESLQSNNLTFTTGSRCEMAVSDVEMSEVETAPAPLEEDDIIHSSIRDTILGVIIAVVAIIIAVVVLYYLYKNHRRRQRILRIFRHSQSDPFETLQDHMEEAFSSSL